MSGSVPETGTMALRNDGAGVVRADEAQVLLQGPLGAQLLVGADRTDGRITLVVHPLASRALGSPLHTHRHEDEYSYVLEGEVGVQLGEETLTARSGDLVCKPRGVPHAFWNASDVPARLLEMIYPGGLERYFTRLGELFARPGPPDLDALSEMAASFGVDVDLRSVPYLTQEHGLVAP